MRTCKVWLCLSVLLMFTATLQAQCVASLLNKETVPTGKKIILAEVSSEDEPEKYQSEIGKTTEVGSAGLTNIGDCWFMGELKLNGEDVFFVGIKINAAKGETYSGADHVQEHTTAANIPVGTKVKVYNYSEADPNSLAIYYEEASDLIGYVIEADLKKDAGGKYSGCIKTDQGNFSVKKCFPGNRVEKIK